MGAHAGAPLPKNATLQFGTGMSTWTNQKGKSMPHVLIFAICSVMGNASAAPHSLSTTEGAFVMVSDGEPRASIVVAQKPTRATHLAALELQYHIYRMTGAALEIVTEGQSVEGARILVGESSHTRELGLSDASFGPQEYLVDVSSETIVLIGKDWQGTPEDEQEVGISTTYESIRSSRVTLNYDEVMGSTDLPGEIERSVALPGFFDEQGTCHAVYDFLERFCDVRWYGPTDLGIVHPTVATLTFEPATIRRTPGFPHREGWTTSPWPILKAQWDDPTPQQCHLHARRMRVGGDKWAANHSFRSYYDRFLRENPDHPELFEGEHSEYFAQGRSQGERQFCYTSPAFVEQVAQDARDFFDGKGIKGIAPAMGDTFAIVPMDNNAWCLCEQCQHELELDQATSGTHFSNGRASGYILGFVNKVAKEVQKTHPDKFIAALAYWDYAYYPERIELEPNVIIAPCLQTRIYWGPNIRRNDIEFYKRWVEEGKRPIYLWLYHCFPEENALVGQFHCFPGFMAHTTAEQLKMYHRDGVRGMFLCGIGEQVDYYVTMKLLNDPDLDVDALLDEFFTRYYGAASEPMKRLYSRIEDIYSDSKNYPAEVMTEEHQFHQNEEIAWGYLGTAEHMAELGTLMEQATQLAETQVEEQRVALFERGVWQYMQEGRARYLVKSEADE